MIMPADLPLWMLATAVLAVVIGKEVFGGTGMNILNQLLPQELSYVFTHRTFR